MKQSQIFTKTRFEAPKDEVAKNAEILIRAGFIHKDMAGVYSFLPLGLRVLKKIEQIIREEMNAIGGQEMELASLQDKSLWEKTDRWSDKKVDTWFKTKLKNDTELGLGFTHEEPLTALLKDHIRSYKDLPIYPYQFQTKFRNETRAKSGILRTREFLMKDLYSFSRDAKEHEAFYEKAKEAYKRVFKRIGIGGRTYLTFASGGVFAKYSHEFQTITDAGEDVIYIDKEKGIAVNKEVYTDEVLKNLGLDKNKLVEKKAVEVGNIFSLGTRFSDALGLAFTDEKGAAHPAIMGSYGIGLPRLMGAIVEIFAKNDAMVWPESVAPFKAHIIDLSQGDEEVKRAAENLYDKFSAAGIDTLFDDRDARAGEKFADADLIGIPHRIVISKKTEGANVVEYTDRITGKTSQISKDELVKILS